MLQSLLEGRINLQMHRLMCALISTDYTPNQNTHKFRSIVIDEVLGSGYVTGGKQITGVQLTYETVNRRLKLTGSNLVWPSVTVNDVRYAVIYVDNELAVTAQPLVAYVDFGENVDRSDEPFNINWPASGILTMTVP